MKSSTKEWIQYGSAMLMVISGVILAFLSFFLNAYDIEDGVLWYIAQALVYAGGIFGVSIYFKTKLGEFESKARKEIEDYIDKKGGNNGTE
jgi:prepilin signal peptidase PulO-like enzyme (type II secretory pathway)